MGIYDGGTRGTTGLELTQNIIDSLVFSPLARNVPTPPGFTYILVTTIQESVHMSTITN